jgi:hypothetical protein
MEHVKKIRVWDKCRKRFAQSDVYLNLEGDLVEISTVGEEIPTGDEYVLQLFTGAYDKNDTPVFEGDILEFEIDGVPNHISEVKQWKWSWLVLEGFGHYPSKVIGNIFETPELLQ